MSLLSEIKKGVASSGQNKGKLIYLKPDTKTRIRFLQDVEDGMKVLIHDSFEQGITALCGEHAGVECPYCGDDSMRHREGYVWSVWDVENKETKLFIGYANNFSPLPNLIAMYETYGTITDRDYVLQRDGKGTGSKYSAIPMDKVRFKNSKAKPYTEQKAIDILAKAFPIDDADAEDEDEKPTRRKSKNSKPNKSRRKQEPEEDEEDEEIENDYEDMSPKELYMECIERGLKAAKKKPKSYYVDMLLDNDLENKDEEDDWDEQDDDEWDD